MKVSIIIPTYNERENLEILIKRIADSLRGREHEIIIVDDNSPDGTWKLAQELAMLYPVKPIKREGKNIKIIAGTDFHGSRGAIEGFAKNIKRYGVDLAAICGDITNFGTIEQAKNLLEILAETGTPIIFVPGNCDPPSLINLRLNGLTCIHGKVFFYGNLAFVGLGGGTISPFNTPFEMSEEEIAKILDKCSESLRTLAQQVGIILVSHTPPKNTRLDKTFSGIHAGSISLRKFIEGSKPMLVLCGHVHEARGCDHIGNSIIVNSGPAKQGNYALITIKDEEVKVELKQERF